jgi:hypothetical protein
MTKVTSCEWTFAPNASSCDGWMSYGFIMIRSPGGEQEGTKAKPQKMRLHFSDRGPLICADSLRVLKGNASS